MGLQRHTERAPRRNDLADGAATLGGRIESGARRAEIEIYRNRAGRSEAAPVTDAEVVGSAELGLQRCDELVLSYKFNDGELAGLEGSLPLRRLTAAAFDCIEADGDRVEAQPRSPDLSRGVNRRHAGAWYDPAAAGQGMLFDIRPTQCGWAGPGCVARWLVHL